MKSLLMAALAVILLISCKPKEPTEERYTQQAPEIETIKAGMSDFEKGDWEAFRKHYADSAKIFHNAEREMNVDAMIAQDQQNTQGYEAYGFKKDDQELERVITDEGEMWVNLWATYQIKPLGMKEKMDIPMSLTFQFVDGKVVKEYGYWDNAPMVAAMMAMQDSTKTVKEPVMEEEKK